MVCSLFDECNTRRSSTTPFLVVLAEGRFWCVISTCVEVFEKNNVIVFVDMAKAYFKKDEANNKSRLGSIVEE